MVNDLVPDEGLKNDSNESLIVSFFNRAFKLISKSRTVYCCEINICNPWVRNVYTT